MRWRAEECSSFSARAPAAPPVAGGRLPGRRGLEEAGPCPGVEVAEEEAEPSCLQGGAAAAEAAQREPSPQSPAAAEDTRGHLVSPAPAGVRRAPWRPVSGGGGRGGEGLILLVSIVSCVSMTVDLQNESETFPPSITKCPLGGCEEHQP